jgi:hypothetical protein
MSISATRVSLLAAIPDGILTSLRGGTMRILDS